MKNIINTNIRLNLNDPEMKKAWENMSGMDRKRFRSYSRLVTVAINAYFEREASLRDDPYLETRQKEDAFLNEVREAVKAASGVQTLSALLSSIAVTPAPVGAKPKDEVSDEALDFANGF